MKKSIGILSIGMLTVAIGAFVIVRGMQAGKILLIVGLLLEAFAIWKFASRRRISAKNN